MKKFLILLFSIALMQPAFCLNIGDSSYSLTYDGVQIATQSLDMRSSQVYLNASELSAIFNAQLTLNGIAFTLSDGINTISGSTLSSVYTVNGKNKALKNIPYSAGTLKLPVKDIAECFGCAFRVNDTLREFQIISPTVKSYSNRVLSMSSATPTLDGVKEALWSQKAAKLEGFVTGYYQQSTSRDSKAYVMYDSSNVYVFIENSGTIAGGECNTVYFRSASGKTYYVLAKLGTQKNVSVKFNEGTATNVSSYCTINKRAVTGGTNVEIKIPFSRIGITVGASFGINVMRIQPESSPIISWMPIQRASYTSSTSYTVTLANVDCGRYGQLTCGTSEYITPESSVLLYRGFNEKELRLSLQAQELTDARYSLSIIAPNGRQISATVLKTDDGKILFEHGAMTDFGMYRLNVAIEGVGTVSVFFDKADIINAGEIYNSYTELPVGTGAITVANVPASSTVTEISSVIPTTPGFNFAGNPSHPDATVNAGVFSFNWTSPFVVKDKVNGDTMPNEELFPQSNTQTVTETDGTTKTFNFYTDASGRNYYLTGALHYLQKSAVISKIYSLSASDKLGAARLMYDFTQKFKAWPNVYDYTTTNATYYTPKTSGLPYVYWGGVWYRWFFADLLSMKDLSAAYARIKDSNAFEVLSAELGVDVEEEVLNEMLLPSIDRSRGYPIFRGNMDVSLWRGLIYNGKSLNKPDLIHEAIELIDDFTKNRFLFDGFWMEVTPSYNAQVTGGYTISADELSGWSDPEGYISPRDGTHIDNLDPNTVLRLQPEIANIERSILYPNGKYFPIRDTWAFSKSRAATSEQYYGDMLLPASGIARVTKGTDQLWLNFAPRYGHNHADNLSLALWADSHELLPDLGYTHTRWRTWAISTLAHNTVAVDKSNSSGSVDGGNLEIYSNKNNTVKIMKASQNDSYSSTSEYNREPWYITAPGGENIILDIFRVTGGKRHEYTLNGAANYDCEFATATPLTYYNDTLLPVGTEYTEPANENDSGSAGGNWTAYMAVKDVSSGAVLNNKYTATMTCALSKLKITGFTDNSSVMYVGRAPSMRATRLSGTAYDINEHADDYYMPKMIIRRDGTSLQSTFVTLMEPSPISKISPVSSIERATLASSRDVAVKINYDSSTYDVVLSSADGGTISAYGVTLNGKLAFVRIKNGIPIISYSVGATQLNALGETLPVAGATLSGTVTGTTRKYAGDEYNSITVDSAIGRNAIGETLIVRHPDGKTHGYPIKDCVPSGDSTIIKLDSLDPGFEITGTTSSEMTSYPHKIWSGVNTFELSLPASSAATFISLSRTQNGNLLNDTYYNASGSSVNTIYAVAVYSGNKMIDVQTEEKTFASGESYTFNKTLVCPEGSHCKFFLLKRETLEPLCAD